MPVQLQLPELHINQKKVAMDTHRFRVCATGRQWGKTLEGAEEQIWNASQGKACWWVFPTFKMTAPAQRYLAWMLSDLRKKGLVHYNKKELMWEFPNGGRIELRSANEPDGLRGDTLDFVLMDEAAYINREAWEMAISPMLGARHGSALFYSTFAGRNWFHELWQFAKDEKDPDWKHFHFTTYDNPYFPVKYIEQQRRILPEAVFAQEYLAEPMEDNALVFNNVRAAAVMAPEDRPTLGHTYVAGLDWGNNQDFSVLIVVDATTFPIRQVHKYRFNQVGWEVQWGWLSRILPFWNPAMIVVEKNAVGEANIAALQRAGVKNIVPFQTSWVSKRLLIESWRNAIEQNNCLLLRDDDIIQEHMAYEASISADGNIKYSAPRGLNDDTVIASALAWRGASGEVSAGKIVRQKVGGLWDGRKRTYPLWGGHTTARPLR